jgi:hypothetical protein
MTNSSSSSKKNGQDHPVEISGPIPKSQRIKMSKTEENTEKKVLTFFVIFFSNFDNHPSLESMK